MTYYIGWLADIFSKANIHILISDCQGGDCSQVIYWLVNNLPTYTIFASLPYSAFGEDLSQLIKYRKQVGHINHVLLHLNDEQPWNETLISSDSNSISYKNQLLENYSKMKLILRGLYHGWKIHNTTAIPIIKSSQRSYLCIFGGRLEYPYYSPHHNDRNEFIQLIKSGNTPCAAHTGKNSDGISKGIHPFSYDEYIKVMSNSVFSPCPGGNNPETFRHYEALELGTIPLFVRPVAERDFTIFWKNYPGPIFSSWTELDPYLRSVTT
eukprot:gene6486-13091_t